MDCRSVEGRPAAHTNTTSTHRIGHGARIHRATCVESVILYASVLLCGSVVAKNKESVGEVERREKGEGIKVAYQMRARLEGPVYCVGSHVDERRAIITEIGP